MVNDLESSGKTRKLLIWIANQSIKQSNNQWSPNNCLEAVLKVYFGLQRGSWKRLGHYFRVQNTVLEVFGFSLSYKTES